MRPVVIHMRQRQRQEEEEEEEQSAVACSPAAASCRYAATRIVGEQVAEERQRVDARVAEAVADPTGRLKLFLNSTGCDRLPDEIGRLRALRELHCDHNPRLTALPRDIAKLGATLQIVCAAHCGLRSVPEELTALRSLRHLDLSHNALTAFFWGAEAFADSLELLNLAHNRVAFLSPGARLLLRALEARRAARARVLLQAPDALFLAPNDFVSPTEHLLKPRFGGGLSADYGAACGAQLLPDHVEQCIVCGAVPRVGRPRVHLVFEHVESSLEAPPTPAKSPFAVAAGMSEAEGGGDGEEAPHSAHPVRVAFFYPLCDAPECSLLLHQRLARGEIVV